MDRRILELASVHTQLVAVGAVAVVHKRGIAENLVAQLQLHTGRHIRGVFVHRHRTLQRHTVCRSRFLYVQDLVAVRRRQLKRNRNGRRNGIYWSIIPTRGRSVGVGVHVVAGPADVKTAQAVEAVQKVGRHIVMKAVAVALRACDPSGTGGRHEVGLVHGREEVLAGNFGSIHGKRRHVLTGICGVEILKLKGTAVLKGNDKIIAITGQRGSIGGKFKNKTRIGSANDICGSTRRRLGKTYVSHDDLLKE